jgi:CP family cyanate transporter-like MFS transporter
MLMVGILLIAANLRPSITAVGPVLNDIRSSLQFSSGVASVLISIPLLAFGLFSPVAPWIARRLGLEGALAAALGVLAVGIAARSLPWPPALWIGTTVLGAAIAVMNVMLPSLVKRDYPNRVGQITGLYTAALSGVAAIAAGIAVPIAGLAHEGWRLSLGVWALLALIALAVLAPRLRRRPDIAGTLSDQPQLAAAAPSYRSPWRSVLGWQVTIFMGVQSIVYFSMITWLPSIEQSTGVSATTAGFHLFLLNIGSLVSNLVLAVIIHRRAGDQRVIATVIAVLIAAGVVGELTSPSFSVVWVCLLGLGTGGSLTLALSLFALRAGHHQQAADLSGMAQSIGYLMAAGGPIAIGILHDATGSWNAALVALLVLIAAQLAISLFASRDRQIG